jgi:hypothetical protein
MDGYYMEQDIAAIIPWWEVHFTHLTISFGNWGAIILRS